MIDYLKIADIITCNNKFLVTTHVNPDADAIGSEIAMYLLLKKLGKEVSVVNYSETPSNLTFLDKDNVIEKFQEDKHSEIFNSVDVIIGLDFNSPGRTVKMERHILESSRLKICIDHHQNPKLFADYYFIDSDSVATGHILCNFIDKTKIVDPDKDMAECLYAAIMTDTGSFRFNRTSPEVHIIASELLKLGADPTEIYNKIFDKNKIGKIRLLGHCLSKMTLINNGSIAYIEIRYVELEKFCADESDIEGFVNYCLTVEGVKIGILFFELSDGLKISFRSKGSVAVNKLAEEFGGGGHINASGARIFGGNFNESVDVVLERTKNYI